MLTVKPLALYWRIARSEPLDRPRTIRYAACLLLDAVFYLLITPSHVLDHRCVFFMVTGLALLIKLLSFPLWCFPENGRRAPDGQFTFIFVWMFTIGVGMAVISLVNIIPLAGLMLVFLTNNNVPSMILAPFASRFWKILKDEEQKSCRTRPLDF